MEYLDLENPVTGFFSAAFTSRERVTMHLGLGRSPDLLEFPVHRSSSFRPNNNRHREPQCPSLHFKAQTSFIRDFHPANDIAESHVALHSL